MPRQHSLPIPNFRVALYITKEQNQGQAMLPLDQDQIADLVTEAHLGWPLLPCRNCGPAPCDYCETCVDFYFIHSRICRLHVAKHNGHRCVLVPFVEAV